MKQMNFKYFLLFCGLLIHFPDGIPLRTTVFNINKAQFIFPFIPYTFNAIPFPNPRA